MLINLSVCLVYLAIMMAVGVISSRKAHTLEGFFLADRKMGRFFIAGSLVATILGGSNTIGLAGLGFKQGLTGSLWLLSGSLGLFSLGIFLAGKVRKFSLYTLPELVETFYDGRVKLTASILICLSWLAIVAGQMIAAGSLLAVVVPVSSSWMVILFSLTLIFYTILGGQYGIIRTDFFQFMIMIGGIVWAGFLALSRVGGLVGLIDHLPKGFFAFPVSNDFGGLDLLSIMILVGSTYLIGPDICSRLFSARDEKTARFSAFFAGILIIPFAFLITAIGMCGRVMFPGIGADEAFPIIIREVLPGGGGGLVIASLLAALMSSADTCLLTISAIFTMDILRPYSGKTFSEKRLLILSRAVVAIAGLLSLLIAFRLKEVIPALFLGYTIFTSGLAIPIIAGFYRDKLNLNSAGALTATLGGGGFALTGKLLGVPYCGLIGFVVSGMLLFTVSRIMKNHD